MSSSPFPLRASFAALKQCQSSCKLLSNFQVVASLKLEGGRHLYRVGMSTWVLNHALMACRAQRRGNAAAGGDCSAAPGSDSARQGERVATDLPASHPADRRPPDFQASQPFPGVGRPRVSPPTAICTLLRSLFPPTRETTCWLHPASNLSSQKDPICMPHGCGSVLSL